MQPRKTESERANSGLLGERGIITPLEISFPSNILVVSEFKCFDSGFCLA